MIKTLSTQTPQASTPEVEAPKPVTAENSSALEDFEKASPDTDESYLDGMGVAGLAAADWADDEDPFAPLDESPESAAPPYAYQDPENLDGNYRDVYRKHRDLVSGARRDETSSRSDEYEAEIEAFKKQWEDNQERYEALATEHGVPASMIAALHKREGDGSFEKYLAQGAPLGKDPKAYGMAPYHKPMSDWDDAADWALEDKDHHREALGITSETRDPAALATYAEMWNGLGYHGRNMPSGYIYAGTDAYEGGHFSKDGEISMDKMSAQPGILALMESVGGIDVVDLDSEEELSRDESWARVKYGADSLDADSTGEGVAALQERLLGDDGVTGEMDEKTLEALHQLQKQSGVDVRDQVGNAEVRNLLAPELWAEMTREDGALDIGSGSTGLSAQLVQQELVQSGKLSGTIDGMFGPKSARALKKAGGLDKLAPELDVDVTDAAKAVRVDVQDEHPIAEGIFKKGAKGEDVRSIQSLLGGLEPDGDFGPKTDEAIRAFQESKGLKPDGKVGPDTRAALYAHARSQRRPAADPKPEEAVVAAAEGAVEGAAQVALKFTEPAPPITEEAALAGGTEADVLGTETEDKDTVGSAPEAAIDERDVVGAEPKAETDKDDSGAPAADVSDVDALLSADWGERTFSRGDAKNSETELLQTALRTLGYLPADATSDGAFGPNTANALMAFQVATSGVDTVETGTDSKGNKTYAKDGQRNRLQGIVDGRVGPGTRAKLMEALQAEKTQRLTGKPADTSAHERSLGDNPEQKAAIADRMKKAGLDPKALMTVDTAQFEKLGLRPHILDAALDAWENQYASGAITNTVITVNDLELPDDMRRSFTFDLATMEEDLKMHELMAHGSGTGGGRWAKNFARSQKDRSNQSVLGGLNVGASHYDGGKKQGITAEGMEQGINDRAHARLIRMHAPSKGDMKESDIIGGTNGYKSWGCLVLPNAAAKTYHDEAEEEGGRFNFNYAPHEHYWNKQNAVSSD